MELKANDLRIGNYVTCGKENHIVSHIHHDDTIRVCKDKEDSKYWSFYNLEVFKPIPLTEEWLTKLGLNVNKWFCENSYCVVEDKMDNTSYGWCMKVKNASHTKEIEFGYFKYVHELQNLFFALTREELKIIH
jgi:hypothetical protein